MLLIEQGTSLNARHNMTPERYKAEVLDELARRFEENHNSLPDAYALIWAIDTYASILWFASARMQEEKDFKNGICENCEAFEIVRSASNAIKHIERDSHNVTVKSIGAIKSGSGPSYYAWFVNQGRSAPSIAIEMNWEYDREKDEYNYRSGKKIDIKPARRWPTQYLQSLYRPAIEGIESFAFNF